MWGAVGPWVALPATIPAALLVEAPMYAIWALGSPFLPPHPYGSSGLFRPSWLRLIPQNFTPSPNNTLAKAQETYRDAQSEPGIATPLQGAVLDGQSRWD